MERQEIEIEVAKIDGFANGFRSAMAMVLQRDAEAKAAKEKATSDKPAEGN